MKELGVRLSMDDLNEMMIAADINQDGRIDYAGGSLASSMLFLDFRDLRWCWKLSLVLESLGNLIRWHGVVGNVFRLKRSYSTPGPVSTAMGDCLRASKPSRCKACQLGRLSLLPSVGR